MIVLKPGVCQCSEPWVVMTQMKQEWMRYAGARYMYKKIGLGLRKIAYTMGPVWYSTVLFA